MFYLCMLQTVFNTLAMPFYVFTVRGGRGGGESGL